MIETTNIKESVKDVKRIERGEDSRGWRWYEVDGIKLISVTQVLDVIQHFQLTNYFKNNSANKIQKTKDSTGQFGSTLHKMVEMDLQDKKITIEEPALQRGFENWSKVKEENHITATHTETMVYSLKYGFAGQLDYIGTFQFKKKANLHRTHAVQDLKTGNYSIKTGWQLAGYRRAAIEMGLADESIGMVGIGVHRDGSPGQPFEYEHLDFCERQFLYALQNFKGLYFNELAKLQWPYLKKDAVELYYKEKHDRQAT